MGQTLEDSIDQMMLEGKTFEQCEFQIFDKWHIDSHDEGYEILGKYLLDGKFNVSRAEAKKLCPELFIDD